MKIIEQSPPAKSLILGIRAIGYSFSTAVADIIDNSISAQATKIDIFSEASSSHPYFAILDNGCGMNDKELSNAMLLGSDRSSKKECESELGRYGLGLKSASLSQCRQFTVISKKSTNLIAISFDLDLIEKTNTWSLKILYLNEIKELPLVNELTTYKNGTLVLWNKFDKIETPAKNFEDTFRSIISDTKKHVELVFHRYYDDIEISFNRQRIEKRDPFLVSSTGRQQTGRTTTISTNGSKITITPYTLPFANTLTTDEKALLGNPKSIYDEQGFYLYRNKRLIFWGSWMRMNLKSELNKLARVKVDIPSSLDDLWMLDVKKSSARIPDKIKEEIKAAINDSTIRSRRTNRFLGIKEQSINNKIWLKMQMNEGVKYIINKENPLLQALYDSIGETEKKLFEMLLSQLECFIPKYSMQNDNADSIKILNSDDDIEEENLIEQLEYFISLFPYDQKEEKLVEQLFSEAYQKLGSKLQTLKERFCLNE